MNLIQIIDTNVYNCLFKLINIPMTLFMTFISFLASATALIVFAIASFFILKNKRDAKFIALNLALGSILNTIIKHIIGRPRPEVLRLVPEDRI